MNLMNELHAFIEGSAKRHGKLKFLQDPKFAVVIHSLSDTRWACRVVAFESMLKAYSAVITFLEMVDDDDHGEIGAKA